MRLTPLKLFSVAREEVEARSRRFYELMACRRTVRDFDSRDVPGAAIEHAIRTAGTAPSGANLQPWHFVAIDRR